MRACSSVGQPLTHVATCSRPHAGSSSSAKQRHRRSRFVIHRHSVPSCARAGQGKVTHTLCGVPPPPGSQAARATHRVQQRLDGQRCQRTGRQGAVRAAALGTCVLPRRISHDGAARLTWEGAAAPELQACAAQLTCAQLVPPTPAFVPCGGSRGLSVRGRRRSPMTKRARGGTRTRASCAVANTSWLQGLPMRLPNRLLLLLPGSCCCGAAGAGQQHAPPSCSWNLGFTTPHMPRSATQSTAVHSLPGCTFRASIARTTCGGGATSCPCPCSCPGGSACSSAADSQALKAANAALTCATAARFLALPGNLASCSSCVRAAFLRFRLRGARAPCGHSAAPAAAPPSVLPLAPSAAPSPSPLLPSSLQPPGSAPVDGPAPHASCAGRPAASAGGEVPACSQRAG